MLYVQLVHFEAIFPTEKRMPPVKSPLRIQECGAPLGSYRSIPGKNGNSKNKGSNQNEGANEDVGANEGDGSNRSEGAREDKGANKVTGIREQTKTK